MKLIAYCLAFIMSVINLPQVHAAPEMISSVEIVQGLSLEHERDQLRAIVARKDVQRQLSALGVDPKEALARVDNLSAAEVEDFSRRLKDAPAGASVGVVVGAAVLVFIVLLVTDVLGLTKVFPFTRTLSQSEVR